MENLQLAKVARFEVSGTYRAAVYEDSLHLD
jgi:hypothetical protein